MRVAVTGISGFTGRYVADALAAAGLDCVPLEVDVTDREAVAGAVADTAFDHLIHLAGLAYVDNSEWRSFYQVHQLGTFDLLDAVARIRPHARCILASSAQVYGPGAEGLITEDAPINPANHYASSKAAMEMGASLWNDRLDVVIARPFNYTGVGQDQAFLIPKLVAHFRERAPRVELGNRWVRRDFGDVRAVAAAYVGLILADQAPRVVNISSGVVHSIDEVLAMLTELSGHQITVDTNPAFVRANDVPVLGGDNSRLAATLPDWRSRDFGETLSWMYKAA